MPGILAIVLLSGHWLNPARLSSGTSHAAALNICLVSEIDEPAGQRMRLRVLYPNDIPSSYTLILYPDLVVREPRGSVQRRPEVGAQVLEALRPRVQA